MSEWARLSVTIRNFLFSKRNREFLIFLFFLSLSGIFWLLMTLNETYEKELAVPIHITNIPADVMLTSDTTDTVRITVRDRGVLLLTYMYGDHLNGIEASFKNYDLGNGNGSISGNEINKLIQQHLSSSAKIINSKPDKLKFYYNTGACKRVPVRWRGRVIPEHLYFLSNVSYSPDSITIYASEEKLDSIRMLLTEPLNYVGFRDTLAVDCRLQKIEGVKMVPDRIKTVFYTDVLTEESMDNIPIHCINIPNDKVLRTFPAKATVRFVTGINVFRTLTPNDFTVIADYNEISEQKQEKCNLYLQKVPQGITRVTLINKQVDYLIEEASR